MISEVLIYDDIIPVKLQEEFKSIMFNNSAWFFIKDVSIVSNQSQSRPAFSHLFYNNKVNSDWWIYVDTIISNAAKKINIDNYKIHQSRSFLQLPLNEEFTGKDIDTPHTDLKNPHLVFLYYLTSSDGDTVIFNEKNYKDLTPDNIPSINDLTVLKRVTPKQGRIIIFDGLHWHTAEQPKREIRCVVNTNISINEKIN